MLFNNGKTVTSENPDTILQQMPTVCWVLPVRCCDTVVNENSQGRTELQSLLATRRSSRKQCGRWKVGGLAAMVRDDSGTGLGGNPRATAQEFCGLEQVAQLLWACFLSCEIRMKIGGLRPSQGRNET